MLLAKTFGPTSSTDDTVTTIGSAYQFPAKAFICKMLRLAYGEITATIEVSGHLIITVPGVTGSPFCYCFGNSGGGAANDRTQTKAEEIPCSIPIPPNTSVTVKVLTAEEVAEITVTMICEEGGGQAEMTLMAGGTGQDPAADTALALTQNAKAAALGATGLTPWRDGVIRAIRFSAGNLVDSKATSGILTISVAGYPYPLEFAVGKGNGGDTSGTIGETDTIYLRGSGIPIKANSAVTVTVTMAEASVSATVSLHCD
jgi:hypothetical protein